MTWAVPAVRHQQVWNTIEAGVSGVEEQDARCTTSATSPKHGRRVTNVWSHPTVDGRVLAVVRQYGLQFSRACGANDENAILLLRRVMGLGEFPGVSSGFRRVFSRGATLTFSSSTLIASRNSLMRQMHTRNIKTVNVHCFCRCRLTISRQVKASGNYFQASQGQWHFVLPHNVVLR